MSRIDKSKTWELIMSNAKRVARESFYGFCKIQAPDFYIDGRPHLKALCDTLQLLYQDGLLREDGSPYKKLMINLPPRLGKSRTLILFVAWVLGINKSERIITCSYNDELAKDFSRYTRDMIDTVKERPEVLVYSDIFPKTKIKGDNSSFGKWALEGEFFTYKGAGLGAGITGVGASIIIADDLVKDAKVAFNVDALDEIWNWYTGTFLQRKEEGSIQIMCATRWSKEDPTGRLLSGPDKDNWYVFNLEAMNLETEEMLCPSLLSKESYDDLKINMDPMIFMANYHQIAMDVEGKLYSFLKEYQEIPKFDKIVCYVDTADTGSDYLAAIIAGLYRGQAYILDIMYTKDSMEYTESRLAKKLFEYNVDVAWIESNNGGRGFARNVQRLLWDNHNSRHTLIDWFHQGSNKQARILSNATQVMNNIYFPVGWKEEHRDAYTSMSTYMREGKNRNDDIQDALTGLAEKILTVGEWVFA